MTTGYSFTGIEKITIPKGLSPLIIDDFTLAFYLGYRNKTLWDVILHKDRFYNKFYIMKSDGVSKRAIHEPLDQLKSILHQVHSNLLLPLQKELGDHVIAYRTGRSISDGIQQHLPKCQICDSSPPGKTPKKHKCPKYGAYIHMDLEDFFHRTSRAFIREYFESLGYSFYVSGLLGNLMTVDDIPHPLHEKKPDKFPEFCSGVPQGAPTSGAICNLVADRRIDHTILSYLEELSNEQGLKGEWRWKYSRYADDITLTCGEDFPHKEKIKVLKEVTYLIRKGGYRVNYDKTKITSAYHRKTLGLTFHQKLNVPKHVYLNTRALVHNCRVYGFESQATRAGQENVEGLIRYVQGKVNYITQAHKDRGQKLKEEFDAALAQHVKSGGTDAVQENVQGN